MVVKVKDENQLIFDFDFNCSNQSLEPYREGAQELIKRIVPPSFLDEQIEPLEKTKFHDLLPMISWSDLSRAPCTFSVLVLTKQRLSGSSFFYDMVTRWLLPNKKVSVELFFTSEISLPHLSDERLSVGEVVIYLKSAQDVEEVKRNIEIVQKELRLGLLSPYHAKRILEFKGLSNDGKTALIQEKIGSLIQTPSKEFDQGIFSEMQNFLVKCSDAFKQERDYHHISRIISNIYSLKTVLRQKVPVQPAIRHVELKILKTQLPAQKRFLSPFDPRGISERLFGEKLKPQNVLGVLVGLNYFHAHEVFELSHLLEAVQKHLPKAVVVDKSKFFDRLFDPSIGVLYLEVQKADGIDFTIDEVRLLKEYLPSQIKANVEQLAHPVFMPRNEEEVLRNIMLLSRQLRFVRDLPQVVISFDEQKGDDLYFTIILLRMQKADDPTVQEIFEAFQSKLEFIPDRIRKIGHVRKKYVKEATVFRTFVQGTLFSREDRSVDIYQARQFVFQELTKLLGPVRDFNGGMLYKQREHLKELQLSLGVVGKKNPVLLERFYYAIDPIEVRTSIPVEDLKQWFILFLQSLKRAESSKKEQKDFLYKQDPEKVFVVASTHQIEQKLFANRLGSMGAALHQLGVFTIEIGQSLYFGSLFLTDDRELQSRFLSAFS